MKKDLISVIMSIYNEEIKWIKEAVESILNQTYRNIQLIIVVDNPSINDNVRNYLEQIKDDDHRIIVIYNTSNIGLARSLNRAIERADGGYIARMDADDVSELNRLEAEYNTINELGVDLVGTGRLLINEAGDQVSDYESPITNNELIQRILPFGSCFVHPTIMIKSSVIRQNNGYRHFRQSQDYDLWLRMLSSGCTFANIDIPLLKYRIRQNGITQKYPYLQYITARYQKKLYWMRKKTGTDTYTEQNFSRYLEKCNAFSKKMNERYADALQQFNTGISLIRSNFFGGVCKIITAIVLFPSLGRLLIEKIKIVYYMKKYTKNNNKQSILTI